MATDCWTALGLGAANPGSFNDTETALDAAATAARTAWDIADIGYTLLMLDGTFIPVLGIISLGLDIYTIIGMFSGRPKFEDTNNVIWAYNMSAYWPLHALATDLKIAEKNGAPISDSNPAIQAQFSAWKQGTIVSIQQFAGWAGGPSDPGYWQLQRLLNYSWSQSGGGQQAVLNVVRIIDRFTQILSCLFQQQASKPPPPPSPPPPGGPPPPPPPGPALCDSGNPEQDEILDFCKATQSSLQAILAAIQALGAPGGRGGSIDPCCLAVVNAIGGITAQLANITAILVGEEKTPPQLDLTPLVNELATLVAAVGAYPPALQACCAAINSSLGNIASAISSAPGTDTTGIVNELKTLAGQGDVDQFIFQALQQQGLISPADEQTLQGIKWSDALSYITSSAPWRTLEKAGKTVEADYTAINNWLINFSAQADNWAVKEVKKGLTVQRNALQAVITPILQSIAAALKPAGAKSIAQIGVNPDTVLADVAAVGLNIQVVAALVSLLREGAGEQIATLGEMTTGLLGFEELREVQLGPLVQYGIARVAEMQAKKTFGQELPGATALASLAARGLISAQQYFTWVPYTGLPGELWEQERQNAYRGLNARQMLRLIETNLFTQAEISDELTFSGMRPVSQTRMEHAAPYLATNTERRALISTLEKAYIQGLMDDPTLTSNIDSSENNVDRDNLILQRVKWEVLIQETKDLESDYTTLYIGGVIDDRTLRGYLSGIGLQPWKINTVAAKAEARASATLQRKTIAAAAALQRATASEERKAAMRNFTEGNINATALGVALAATGLTATQAVAWTDLATLQKAGALRWQYGLQLSPAEATLLRNRVAALTDQRKRLEITDPQYVSGLQALNLPPRYINALQAQADALITPKKSAFPIPVQTG